MANIFDLFRKIEKSEAALTGAPAYLVVGLGNPGKEYASTRHNAGFLAIDHIAAHAGAKIDRVRFKGLTGGHALRHTCALFKAADLYESFGRVCARGGCLLPH